MSVVLSEWVVRSAGWAVTKLGVTVNGQSAGIMLILVFGAGTDYALLLVARYREELHQHRSAWEAMSVALRAVAPAILASAGTVVCGLLVLLLADVNGTSGMGATGALGVSIVAIGMLTLLPALLASLGRWVFWPFIPKLDGASEEELTRAGVFARIGQAIERRPRRVWIVTTLTLLVLALGLTQLRTGLTQANGFRGDLESVGAQKVLARSFAAGDAAPIDVFITKRDQVDAATRALQNMPKVTRVEPADVSRAATHLVVYGKPDGFSQAGYDLVHDMRRVLDRTVGADANVVGGASAVEADLSRANMRDVTVLPPIVLAVIFVILVLLLRALVAPIMLIATVVLSFAATLGLSAFLYRDVWNFPGIDPGIPLYIFVFLVALGVDYNIFLMARVREESDKHGTREGMLRGLAVTGSVITSAGVVLAGTFAVLIVLPIVALMEVGIAVALGVLLDTALVRTVLVPALTFDLGDRVWWPWGRRRAADQA